MTITSTIIGAKNWPQTCSFIKHIILTMISITYVLNIVTNIPVFV